jgi:hypothetical protein
MIEVIFTLDYEIYGNGQGDLRELVYEPAERLNAIFKSAGARVVIFAEVAELEMIEAVGADPAIKDVIRQIKEFHRDGFELGLHIHPWWYSARRENGGWVLDKQEYNLCIQPEARIIEIVDRAIAYLRHMAGDADLVPLAFRAGHLIFQPTEPLSRVLAERGIRIDSSVYRGGLWRQHKLDYRRVPRTYYWRFADDVAVPDDKGDLFEFPIYTRMVPTWKLFTAKRVGLQQTGVSAAQTGKKALNRIRDFLRFRHPQKFDMGQMTEKEMFRTAAHMVREDRRDPANYRPIVAIMHTKDPIDFAALEFLISYLSSSGAKISTFKEAWRRLKGPAGNPAETE